MRGIGIIMLCLSACLVVTRPAEAQKAKAKPKASKEVTADQLGKEMVAIGGPAMIEKYQGKKLRIRGEVGSVTSNYVYMKTASKFEDGSEVNVVAIFPEKSLPKDLDVGKELVIDGAFKYATAMGPSFDNCALAPK